MAKIGQIQMMELKALEEKYKVETIKVNGIAAWPFLRIPIAYHLRDAKLASVSQKVSNLNKIKARITSLFYGFTNLFKKCDILFVSNSMENKLINGKFKNKLFFTLFEEFKNKNLSYLEIPAPQHPALSATANPAAFSSVLLDVWARVLSFFISPKLENFETLDNISREINLKKDFKNYIKVFLSYQIIFKILFQIKKPKVIFCVESYSQFMMALIFVAKTQGIKVIEVQHGVINPEHFAYSTYKNISDTFYPDYFLVFGEYFKNQIQQHAFIKTSHILPFGHPYLNHASQSKNLITPTAWNGYIHTANVTLQYINEEEVIDFINKAAALNPDILFLLIKRNNILRTSKIFDFPKNVIFEENLDFYACAPITGVHVTHSSTCAVEAPVLGQPNILIALDNVPKAYYGKLLNNDEVSLYIEKPSEFRNAFHKLLQSKAQVQSNFDSVIDSNHLQRVQELSKYLQI